MRKSTFNYIKDILADYPRIEEYINQREEELLMNDQQMLIYRRIV